MIESKFVGQNTTDAYFDNVQVHGIQGIKTKHVFDKVYDFCISTNVQSDKNQEIHENVLEIQSTTVKVYGMNKKTTLAHSQKRRTAIKKEKQKQQDGFKKINKILCW